jgi:phosphoenolpyruvate carboxylase
VKSLPEDALRFDLRMTEQGETIAQKYANLITATYNLELLLAGAAQTTLLHRAPARAEDPAAEAAMERLAGLSRDVYRELLADPAFLPYWAGAAPVDALEASSIGSRPARRTGARSLADLRAIPWVFGWNQNRHYITGWYGLGGGLARLRERHPEDYAALRAAVQRWPFLRNLLYNAETTLASADPGLMASYAALVEDAAVRDHVYGLIKDEYHACEREIGALFSAPRESRRPRMLRTVRLRDPGLRRLHGLQTELLSQWRRAVAEKRAAEARALLPTVLFTLNAVASGLRNTG